MIIVFECDWRLFNFAWKPGVYRTTRLVPGGYGDNFTVLRREIHVWWGFWSVTWTNDRSLVHFYNSISTAEWYMSDGVLRTFREMMDMSPEQYREILSKKENKDNE